MPTREMTRLLHPLFIKSSPTQHGRQEWVPPPVCVRVCVCAYVRACVCTFDTSPGPRRQDRPPTGSPSHNRKSVPGLVESWDHLEKRGSVGDSSPIVVDPCRRGPTSLITVNFQANRSLVGLYDRWTSFPKRITCTKDPTQNLPKVN